MRKNKEITENIEKNVKERKGWKERNWKWNTWNIFEEEDGKENNKNWCKDVQQLPRCSKQNIYKKVTRLKNNYKIETISIYYFSVFIC